MSRHRRNRVLHPREITHEMGAVIPQKIALQNGGRGRAKRRHGADAACSFLATGAAPFCFPLGVAFGFPLGIQVSLWLGDLFRDLWPMSATGSRALVGWMEQIGEQIADRRAQWKTQQMTEQRADRKVEQDVANALRR